MNVPRRIASLDEIVRFLNDHGNPCVDPKGFVLQKDGWVCRLRNPIYFDLLSQFSLPENISLEPEVDEIFDTASWSAIEGKNHRHIPFAGERKK